MKKNMGSLDRMIRIIVAISLAVLYWQGIVEGILAYLLLAVATVFVFTSFMSFCPFYTLIGYKSCPRKQATGDAKTD
ncbi:MAG TPA: DUF2892 domain-containing protein [Flavobacteriaceae bacterium]|jgi:hypothetical protein|nr:DUF2892 domain-containing protein [Flavobacteriaceae bacterium]HIN97848.1 DUF2892 domain-containing protein [Flavobacteriaceae bacterium]|tara:strand:- start:94642 stop:94872 length:231 start_codon:yes stop_codon:yes gene_type:complete